MLLKLIEIKTPRGIYLSEYSDSQYSSKSPLLKFSFDGHSPMPTFHKDWVFVKEEPKSISREVQPPSTNFRYELKDVSLASDKIPKSLSVEVTDECGDWLPEFTHLRSLYELKSDIPPKKTAKIDFQIVDMVEFDNVQEFNGFAYPIMLEQRANTITEKDIDHQLLDQILFPSLILPSRPSRLSSKQSYDIVRQYIKNNINPQYAEITSDYAFCFEVVKKIELAKPEEYEVERLGSGRQRKKPRTETKTRRYRQLKIYEMTYSPENYRGYTPIKPFEGKDQQDLQDNIDQFLEKLIIGINEPLKDCPVCEGKGVIMGNRC